MQNENNIKALLFSKNLYSTIIYKLRHLLKFIGPAFIVSVAYIDPGNFATNISGGSKFNYTLLWVILWSNVMAIFLQIMSAKVGIATGHNIPYMCSVVFPKYLNFIFWIIAEIGAMATDLAEFIGGTLGIYLLFKIPMTYSALITGVATYLICCTEKYGQKIVEFIIFFLVTIIAICYTIELFFSNPNLNQVCIHTLIPEFTNSDSVLVAVGMLGATVMPHVIYLHSNLVKYRCKYNSVVGKSKHLKMEKIDIFIAMNIAFIINAAMVVVSAAVFYKNNIYVNTIEDADKSLQPLLGSFSCLVFAVALIASGLSSSSVGTMAGQTIMKGFVNLNIPIKIRRIVTMLPALIIIFLGINPMKALVLSQVVLSFILPFPIIQMLYIANRKDLMGSFVNKKFSRYIGIIIASIIIGLNIFLLYLTLF